MLSACAFPTQSMWKMATGYTLLGYAPRYLTLAAADVQLDADCAARCPGFRGQSAGLLPQPRQAPLQHAPDDAAGRQPEELHDSIGKVPLPAGKHLRRSFC